jgi:hypothetical protein
MALITRTYLVDDIDGSEDDVSRITFMLDRKDYEIDLSAANTERLRGTLEKFVAAATPSATGNKVPARRAAKTAKPTKASTVRSAATSREQTQAVRDWARNNGFEVSNRGRISKSIQDAFDAAH